MRADGLQLPAHRQHARLRLRRRARADAELEGLQAHPRHQHHRCRPPDRRCRCGRGQAGEGGGRTRAVDLGHREALHRGLLGRRESAQHPPAGRMVDRYRLHRRHARIRREHCRRALLRTRQRSLLRRVDGRRLRAARPGEDRRGRGPDRGGRGQAQRRRLRHLAQDPAGREAADGVGQPVGPRRARLAPRMLGDERQAARLPVRHPHRRDRPPGDPPPQRDRPEPGFLPFRRERREGVDAQQLPRRTLGKDEQVARANSSVSSCSATRATTRSPTG